MDSGSVIHQQKLSYLVIKTCGKLEEGMPVILERYHDNIPFLAYKKTQAVFVNDKLHVKVLLLTSH